MTYAPVGATRSGELPPGFRHLRYRTPLGTGEALYRRAGEAVLTFRMHRATGARIRTTAGRAEPGVRLTVVLGPLRAPCEVVWTSTAESKTGFGYGTLAGHPARGEEAFLVERDERDRVWFAVTAYSRPASPLMRLAGPAAVVMQHLYARLLGRAETALYRELVSTTEVTWWGHSTMWLADSGTTLLTDPVLTGRVAHLRRMAGPPPRLPGPPDAVLLSHLHADHFHLASLRIVPGEPRLIVPRGAGPFVARSLGAGAADRCVELAPGEDTAVGGVRVRAVRAAHDGGRGPWSRERAVALGFVVEGAARTWYAGDTGLFDEMNDLAPLDLALIPVGGWGPTLGSHGHCAGSRRAGRCRCTTARCGRSG